MQFNMIGRLKSICKLKEEQVVDYNGQEKSICNSEYQALQIQRLSQRHLRQQINPGYRYIRNPSSFHLFRSQYTTKQEKDYAIQRIGVGLARRS